MLCNGSVARQLWIPTRFVEKWRKRHQWLSDPRAIKGDANFDKIVNLAFAWPFGPPFTRKYGKELFSNNVENTQLNTANVSRLLYKICTVSLFPSSLFLSLGSSRSDEVEMSFT